MVLDRYRSTADKYLVPIARHCKRISPNTLTLISVVFSLLVALLYYLSEFYDYPAFLGLAAVGVLLSGVFDALDGKVARLTGKDSRTGDLVDHVCDRYADMILVGGIAFSGLADPVIVLLAITGVFMTSYMGTQAQALGTKRNYGGLLGRADRLVILMGVLVVQFVLLETDTTFPGDFTLVEWMLLVFAILGHATAFSRFHKSFRELTDEQKDAEKSTNRPATASTPDPGNVEEKAQKFVEKDPGKDLNPPEQN